MMGSAGTSGFSFVEDLISILGDPKAAKELAVSLQKAKKDADEAAAKAQTEAVKLANAQRQFDTAKADAEKTIEAAKAAEADLTKTKSEKEQVVLRAESQIRMMDEAANRVQNEQIAVFEAKKKGLEKQIEDLTLQMTELQRQVREAQKLLTSTQEAIAALKAKL